MKLQNCCMSWHHRSQPDTQMEKYLNDEAFRTAVSTMLVAQVYNAIRARAAAGTLPTSRPAPGSVSAP